MIFALAYCATLAADDTTEEVDLTVEIDYTPGDPGRTTGPWEHCYPATGADMDVMSVALADTGAAFGWTPTAKDLDALRELADAAFEDAAGDAAIDAYEARCDY